ncbi:MAG: hypothetical protein HY540_06265 [Deltaproteobacteria bacterium]|nr:hypothetical protein [Deltaproteobacteria bacterium]
MSLNQHYTWKDFLKEHPEHKEKKLKRSSAEGSKAFEAAFKKYMKEYLKERMNGIERMTKKISAKRAELSAKQKDLVKTKKWPKIRIAQARVGRKDAALARLAKQTERTKELQKNF